MAVRALPSPTQIFIKLAIPFVNPPTGSMANNGVFTLGTALSRTLAGCYMWFATGQLFAGSVAGWYWTTMSSTTAAQVTQTTYASGFPTTPASPVNIVGTGPGAITGVTGGINGITFNLPAGIIGPTGVLRFSDLWSVNNSANNKTVGATLGGQAAIPSPTVTTVVAVARIFELFNNNNVNQVSIPPGIVGGTGQAGGIIAAGTLNFANSQSLVYTLNLATATDWIIHEALKIEVMP